MTPTTTTSEPREPAADDDGQDRAVWEPITFRVGQRVRIAISPECEYCEQDRLDLEGACGVVVDVAHDDDPWRGRDPAWARDYATHHIWLALDGRDRDDVYHFAAIELIPLADDGPAEGTGEGQL